MKKQEEKKPEKPFVKSPFTKDYFICGDCEYIWEPCGNEIDCPYCGSYSIYDIKTININEQKIKD